MRASRAAVLATVFVPALAAAQEAPERASVGHFVSLYEKLSVPESSVPVRDVRLSSGHLTLVLTSGSATPVQSKGEIVGLFFEGKGALEYGSEDPVEFPVMAFNLKKASSLKAEKADRALLVRDRFERVLWLTAGRPLPELPGGDQTWKAAEERLEASVAAGPPLEASFHKFHDKFRRALGAPISHVFAAARAEGSPEPVVVAEIDGGKEDWRYVDDEAEERSERLELLRRPESRDSEMRRQLYEVTISEQPIGRDRRDPAPAAFLLTEVRVDLRASDGKNAWMTVVETVVPQSRPRSVFRFNLESTVYDVVGAGALSPRIFRLKSVVDATGRPLSFHHWNGDLLVGLPEPAAAGQPVKLTFEIAGDFLIRPGGDNYWELGVEPWFPQPDLSGQFYSFHALVRVQRPFVPFAPGRTLSRRTDGDTNILETEIDKPVQFAVILAGKYEWKEERRGDLTIRMATYAGRNERAMKQLAEFAFGVIAFYESFLGPFPFPEFNILEINEYGFGQAPPGVLFIAKEAFNPLLDEANQFFSQGVNERFAHEIAHQYWGHVVKMPSLEEQWLTESFAEYSAAIFLKTFKGESTYKSLVRLWRSRAKSGSDASPIPLANRVAVPGNRYLQFKIRSGLVYDKGAYLLSTLHKEMGDQMFLTALKSFQKSLRWKFGSTRLFAGLLEFVNKKDYAPFFEANYWGTGLPPD